MTIEGTARVIGSTTLRGCRWLLGCAGDMVTSLENRLDRNDVKTLAVKLGPRLIAVGGAAKAAGVSKAAVAAGIIRESLAQEDVFLAAMALLGAIAWSIHETLERRKAGPNVPPINPPGVAAPVPPSTEPTSDGPPPSQ